MSAHIGVTGLAVMGANLARNFARHGYTVAVHNRSAEKTEALLSAHSDEGHFVPASTLEELVDSLEKPRRVLIMVKAGAPVDSVIQQLIPLLEKEDIIIDAGNSHFEDTRRREAELAEHGLHFVGVGVSGGEEGALLGPSIMPGGSAQSYQSLGPMLENIAADYQGQPCCTWIGTDGAGHFVKMVHNGIEYADMQVIGEAYDLLRSVLNLSVSEVADTFREWNTTELSSYLIGITAEVLSQNDSETGKPLVDVIVDQAGQKGTGRWTVISGVSLGSPISAIAESVFARALSSQPEQRRQAQEIFGGGDKAELAADQVSSEDIRQALYASKLVSYAQGLDMLSAAATEYGWDLKLDEIAALWREGCIIRADLLNDIMEAYQDGARPANLLLHPAFAEAIKQALPAWRKVVAVAASHGVPAPVFSSGLAYFDGLRRGRLPASLTQGLRDFFGAHTYHRIDKEGTFHTQWSEDRSEIQAVDTH